MAHENEQPDLDYIIDKANKYSPKLGYTSDIWYEFSCGYSYQNLEIKIEKPSYNLRLHYGDTIILEVCYELDVRFGLEVRESEIERIENLLADRAVAVMALNGVGMLLKFKSNHNSTPNSIIKESDDKAFLSLN